MYICTWYTQQQHERLGRGVIVAVARGTSIRCCCWNAANERAHQFRRGNGATRGTVDDRSGGCCCHRKLERRLASQTGHRSHRLRRRRT